MALEDEIRLLREEVTALRSQVTSALARIEGRLPPNLGDRSRLRELTGFSDATISRRVRDGQIRSVKVGGRRLFDLSQFEPIGADGLAKLVRGARRA